MKLTQTVGLVIAAHVVVLLLFFASPGCASRRKPVRSTPEATVVGTQPDTLSPISVPTGGTLDSGELNPGTANFTPLTTDPAAVRFNLPPPTTGGDTGRFTPTRPGAAPVAGTLFPDAPSAPTYTVVAGDSLWKIAKAQGVSVPELRAANNLSSSGNLRVGQKLIIPGQAAAAPASAPASDEATTYTVVAGDTLGGIARKHSTTVGALRALNNLRGDIVRSGQTLKIPGAATYAGGNGSGESRAPEASPAPTPVTPAVARPTGESFTHTVAPGETLGAIARRYDLKIADIATPNAITDPTKLRAGQKLTIPGVRAAARAPTPSPVQATPPAPTPAEPSPFTPVPLPDLDAGLPASSGGDVPTLPIESSDIPVITPAPETPPAP